MVRQDLPEDDRREDVPGDYLFPTENCLLNHLHSFTFFSGAVRGASTGRKGWSNGTLPLAIQCGLLKEDEAVLESFLILHFDA